MIAVVDYGMGNLHSMAKALEYVGEEVRLVSAEDELRGADRIVLPGVGAFGEAMANLGATGLVEPLREEVLERGKPFLGVCLGMQLLAGESEEHGTHAGLGWVAGRVEPLAPADGARVPHTGWSEVSLDERAAGSPLAEVRPGEAFYFNHSLQLKPDDGSLVAATADHGGPVVAAIAKDNMIATQFHPEKSQRAGLEFLAAFAGWSP